MADADSPSEDPSEPPRADSTSTSLLERAKAGDSTAWRDLELLYQPLVQWWCRNHGLHKWQDVEDVTQEVFVTVVRRIAEFDKRPHGGFRAWLRAITHNKVRDHFKRCGKEPEALGGSDALDLLQNVAEPADEAPAPEDPAEITILLRSALDYVRRQVQPQTFEAAWQVLVEERDPADVAGVLGLSVASVYAARSRVLKRVRDLLKEARL